MSVSLSHDRPYKAIGRPGVFLRLLEIAWVGAVMTLGSSPGLIAAKLTGDKAAFYGRLGLLIRRVALRLGPVTVKLAQMASYRRDLIPEEVLAPLSTLQDDVHYDEKLNPRQLLRAALAAPPDHHFHAVDETPLATGSIAVVFRAAAKTPPAPVAIKVVRPGTETAINRDISALRLLAGLAGRMATLRGIPVVETFEQIAAVVVRQSDMRVEGRNNDRLSAILEPVAGVVVPRIRTDLTRKNLLVMELFDGWKKIDDPSIPAEQFRKAADSLLHALFRMVFTHGFIHCDLHPGNVLVSPEGRVALIDAGLVAELDEFERRRFRNFFFAFAQGDSQACARIILEIASGRPEDLDERAYRDDIRALIKTHHGKSAGEFLIAGFVFQIFSLQQRYRLYGTPGFVNAIWALAMFEGLVRRRYPDLDFQGEARIYLTSEMIETARAATERTRTGDDKHTG